MPRNSLPLDRRRVAYSVALGCLAIAVVVFITGIGTSDPLRQAPMDPSREPPASSVMGVPDQAGSSIDDDGPSLRPSRQRHARSEEKGEASAPFEPLVLEIEVVAEVTRGASVSGARVRAVRDFPFGALHPARLESVDGHTGDDGLAKLKLSRGGRVSIHGHHPDLGFGKLEISAYEGGRHHVRVVLRPAFAVYGVVNDESTGLPIEGARVTCMAREDMGLAPVLTDASGRFEVGPWPPGAHHGIQAWAPGYGQETARLLVRGMDSWETLPRFGHPAEQGSGPPFIVLALVREKVVRGRVVDDRGGAVAGARVRAKGEFLFMENSLREDVAEGRTDERGRWSLAGLRSDITHAIGIEAPGFSYAVRVCRSHETSCDVGTVQLAPAATLTGRVVDASSRPAAGVRVELHGLADTDREPRLSPGQGHVTERDGWASFVRTYEADTYCNASGTFEFAGVPEGRARLRVHATPFDTFRRDLELPGTDTELDLLVLDEELPTLEGRVTRDGRPAPELRVQVAEIGTHFRCSALTDEKGEFTIRGVGPGKKLVVRVLLPEGHGGSQAVPLHRIVVTAESKPLSIRL